MSAVYVDASTLASIALDDPKRSRLAMTLLKRAEHVLTSKLSIVECQAGLSSQLAKDPRSLVIAEQNFNRILHATQLLLVNDDVLQEARHLVRKYRATMGLRGADAIHVASASLAAKLALKGLTYLTSDQRQHQVFTAEGFVGQYLP